MLRDAEEGSARSTAGASSPSFSVTHTLGQKGPRGVQNSLHHALTSLTGPNISRMTLRDYINIYIIKYKLKKNSVKNTMWKKMLWVFIFVPLLLLLLLLFYSWILTFLLCDELQYFSALKREVQGRRQWSHSLMMQRLEPVLRGPLWHSMAPHCREGFTLVLWLRLLLPFLLFPPTLSDKHTACPTTFTDPI